MSKLRIHFIAIASAASIAAGGQACAQSIGLFKDGQLIEGFDTGLALSSNAQATAYGNAPNAEEQARNQVLAASAATAGEIAAMLADCKSNSHAVNASALSGLFQKFMKQQVDVRAAHDAVGSRLAGAKAPNVITQRHNAMLADYSASLAQFTNVIENALLGKPGAVDAALAVMTQNHLIGAPVLGRQGQTHSIQPLIQAPRLTEAQADSIRKPKIAPSRVAVASPDFIAPPTTNDLAATPDAQQTPAIIAMTQSLGNDPLSIFEFVQNQIAFQPYLGTRKGADFTLAQRAGNDTDQASLLIALLRAAGVPCRYVMGTVQMTPAQAMSWLGVEDPGTAGNILTTAGMGGINIVNGTNVIAVQCNRVWVEAYVPYGNYRGVVHDQTGQVWIPLDPAFKLTTVSKGQDVLTAMGYNNSAFLANYITTYNSNGPIAVLQNIIQDYLNTNQPGTTVAQIERTVTSQPFTLGLLPASVPGIVLAAGTPFPSLSSSNRYQIRFNLYNGGTTFIDLTTNLCALAGHQVLISYAGATSNDQAVINSYGGVYQTPPYLVNVVPILKLDGTPIATSTNSIGMGNQHNMDIYFDQPAGAQNVQPMVSYAIYAGNSEAVGLDTFRDAPSLFSVPTNSSVVLENVLNFTAQDYLSRVDQGEEQADGLLRTTHIDDVSEAVLGSSVSVTYSIGGTPQTFQWTGLFVDAKRRITGPFGVTGDTSKPFEFETLTGYDGSYRENEIFEFGFAQSAVSTIRVLQWTHDQGIPTCYISNSIASACPGFSHSSTVLSAVDSALASGDVVIIPQKDFTEGFWSGTGYIDLNPTTGAASYIISGGASSQVQEYGGATVQTWSTPLPCAATMVTCNVTQPSADSPDPSAVFCAGDNNPLSFTVQLTITCQNGSTQVQPWSFQTSASISSIAATYGAGDYDLSVSVSGSTQCTRKLTIFNLVLTNVTFGGGNYDVYQDTAPQNKYPTPHWQTGRSTQSPVCYVMGTAPSVTADFVVQPSTFTGSFKIKASGPDSISFPEMMATASGGIATYPLTASTVNFKSSVAYYNTFDLSWQEGAATGTYCLNATSQNRLYLTLAAPTPPKLFDTVLFLACSTQGATTAATAAANTWSQLSGPGNFKTWDGRTLYYYKTGLPFATCYDTAGILQASDGNGQCGAWAHLLMDAFSANGLTSDFVTVSPTADSVFAVKSWTFGGPSYPGTAPYSYKLQFQVTYPEMVPVPAGSKYGDMTSLATLPGQNTTPPSEKVFARHFIIKYNGGYYDPSYGVTYTGANDFENKSVDAYADTFTGDNPAGFTRLIMRAEKSAGLNHINFDK